MLLYKKRKMRTIYIDLNVQHIDALMTVVIFADLVLASRSAVAIITDVDNTDFAKNVLMIFQKMKVI